MTSPSCTMYSLPSRRSCPRSRASFSPPADTKASKATVSARMKPFSKSLHDSSICQPGCTLTCHGNRIKVPNSTRQHLSSKMKILKPHVCITPAACGAVMPARMVQARVSFSPGGCITKLLAKDCPGPLVHDPNCYPGNMRSNNALACAASPRSPHQQDIADSGQCAHQMLRSCSERSSTARPSRHSGTKSWQSHTCCTRTCGEVGAQPELRIGRADERGQPALRRAERGQKLSRLRALQLLQLRLNLPQRVPRA
jgi:hypothetical protein